MTVFNTLFDVPKEILDKSKLEIKLRDDFEEQYQEILDLNLSIIEKRLHKIFTEKTRKSIYFKSRDLVDALLKSYGNEQRVSVFDSKIIHIEKYEYDKAGKIILPSNTMILEPINANEIETVINDKILEFVDTAIVYSALGHELEEKV